MNKYLTVVFVAIVLLCAFAATPAKADSVDTFVWVPCAHGSNPSGFCGPQTSGPGEITWQADASLPNNQCQLLSFCFNVPIFNVTSNGIDQGSSTMYIFSGPSVTQVYLGGRNGQLLGFLPELWAPSYTPGTFLLGSFFATDAANSYQSGTLNVFGSTGVPEPSTLLLTDAGLLGGLAVIAFWRKEPSSTTCS